MIAESKVNGEVTSRCLNCQGRGGFSHFLPAPSAENNTMRKKHSPHLVRFVADTDPHFAKVELVKLSTGEVKARHLIIASDLQQWKRMYSDDGFKPVAEEVQVAPQKTELNRSKSDKVNENCTTIVQ